MTILRKAEHRALHHITLRGRVLDLGGHKHSAYHQELQGTYEVTILNRNPDAHPDIIADLEKPLPCDSGSYDAVLLINVLEHIFEYRALLLECARVLTAGGRIVIVVPYLFPYHPSPDDYHRYSATALKKALAISGFDDIHIESLGTGVFAVRYALIERLLPPFLRWVSSISIPMTVLFDRIFTAIARSSGKLYQPDHYALGFVVTATKP